jgi:chorismate mutase
MPVITKSKIKKIRKKIDVIDLMIIKQINRRFALTKKIIQHKKLKSFKLTDKSREKLIIKKLQKSYPDLNKSFINALYKLIFSHSKKF